MLRKRKSSCSFLLVALFLCACPYAAQKSTGGSQLAAPQLYLPLDGMQIAGFDGPPRLSLSWVGAPHANGYRLQICKDATCATILVDAKRQEAWYPLTSAPENATVFWRVCAIDSAGNGGAWCAARRVTFGYPEKAGLIAPMSISDEHVIGVVPLAPRKDTRMLCLDWYNYDQQQKPGPDGCFDAPVGGHPWNNSHVAAVHFCAHEMGGCWLAATEMLNHYRGHNLTFDEMKFHESGGGPPEGDFPHGLGYGGGGGTDGQCRDVLAWALSVAISQLNESTTMLTEAQVRTFIAASRPIYLGEVFSDGGRHASIIDGYHVNGTTFEVHNLNTDNDGNSRWVSLDSLRSTFQRYFCPTAGTTGRNTDPSISTDSDGDGMVDFDEINRFHTDPHDWDSDHDGISDMNDVHGPLLGSLIEPPINPDIDGDGLRAELDFDSDNGGVPDGYEDRNDDGCYDVGETSPFIAGDDPAVPSNLTLANMTISTKQTYLARNSVTIAPATTVTGSADVIFAAGNTITINSGFQTSNGVKMKVWRDPHLQ